MSVKNDKNGLSVHFIRNTCTELKQVSISQSGGSRTGCDIMESQVKGFSSHQSSERRHGRFHTVSIVYTGWCERLKQFCERNKRVIREENGQTGLSCQEEVAAYFH